AAGLDTRRKPSFLLAPRGWARRRGYASAASRGAEVRLRVTEEDAPGDFRVRREVAECADREAAREVGAEAAREIELGAEVEVNQQVGLVVGRAGEGGGRHGVGPSSEVAAE